jgi:hypothetical protein
MRRFALVVLLATVLVCVWGIFSASLDGLCLGLLVVLPPFAVGMVGLSRGQLMFVNPAGEITTYAFLIILLASVVLLYRSMDIQTLNPFGPAPYAMALAMAFVALIAWIDRPAVHVRLLVTLAVLGFIWGWGCANYFNMAFEVAPKQFFHPAIMGHTLTRPGGRYEPGGSIRFVAVDPWGPISRPTSMVVSEALYDSTQRGASLCIGLGRGLLGWSYYSVVECPRH